MFANDQLGERWQVGEYRELKASPFKVSFPQFFFFSFSFNNFSFHILFFMALAMQCDVKTWQALESGDADATATTMFRLEKLKKEDFFYIFVFVFTSLLFILNQKFPEFFFRSSSFNSPSQNIDIYIRGALEMGWWKSMFRK